MTVHTCQCRCVPHVEDHCRNGEPDFPPEVIEKEPGVAPCLHPEVRTFRSHPPHSKCLACGSVVEQQWVEKGGE